MQHGTDNRPAATSSRYQNNQPFTDMTSQTSQHNNSQVLTTTPNASSADNQVTLSPKPLYSRVAQSIPKKDQAIIFPALEQTKIKEYLLSVSSLIGSKSIIAASRISHQRICMYLASKKSVDTFIEQHAGIVVNSQFLSAKRLVEPSKKIILSNVHPCIPDTYILEALMQHGIRPTSALINMKVRIPEHNEFDHISSFRRFIFISDDKNVRLPGSLLIHFDNENYRIFISSNELYCFHCHLAGHISAECDSGMVGEKSDSATDVVDLSAVGQTTNTILADIPGANSSTNKRGAPSSTISDISTISEPVNLSQNTRQQSHNTLNPKNGNQPGKNGVLADAIVSKPPAKKLKNVDTAGSTSEEPNSSTANGRSQTKIVRTSKETAIISTKQLLEPIQENLTANYTNKNYPISPANFSILIDMVNGNKSPMDTVLQFTADVDGIIKMLDDNYSLLTKRSIKIRFTKLKKRLLTSRGAHLSQTLTESESEVDSDSSLTPNLN